MHIFITYAKEQRSIAEPIAFSLRARGHDVFLDRDDLPPGRSFGEQIQAALQKCDLLVFLISPDSVAPGRFTLTELEFARQHWRTANNRLLPVMVAPTPMADVPAFARAVTILEPKGDVVAETAAAVDELRSLDHALKIAALMACFGALSGLAGMLTLDERGLSLVQDNAFLKLAPGVGAAFGAVIGGGAYWWGLRRWWVAAVPFAVVLVMWLGLHSLFTSYTHKDTDLVSSDLTIVLGKITALEDKLAGVATAETTKAFEELTRQVRVLQARYRHFTSGLLLGVLTSVGTIAGVSIVLPAFRSLFRWLLIAVFGSSLIATTNLMFLTAEGEKTFTQVQAGLLFVVFEAALAGLIGYWLARGRRTMQG